MKPIYLTLISILLTLTSFTQTQPQFKFWLAFEDSIGAKDTLWVVFDSSATNWIDSALGELPIQFDSTKFQVYTSADGIPVNLIAINTMKKEISASIFSQNYHLPITVRWDSSLLRNNDLPWDGVYGYLENHYIFSNIQFTPYRFAGLDKFNSIELIPFQQGGGMGSHFPLGLKITEENIYQVSVNQLTKSNSINIYPNPTNSFIRINTNGLITYQVYNSVGKILLTGSNKLIDLTQINQLTPQILFIKITTNEKDFIIKKILFIP